MPSFYVAPTANFISKTLNGAITDLATTITLSSTTNVQAPGVAVVDRTDSAGTSTPNAREVIAFTGISGNDLTGVTRAFDASTARSHSDGAIVEFTPATGMWNSLTTIVATAMTSDGYLKAIPSPVSIAIGRFTQFDASSIASIARIQTIQMVIESVASIGLIQSNTHGGLRGHFLWTVAGALTTSLATSSNNVQISFLRATKNLTLNSIYIGLNSAPSLTPFQADIYSKVSTPTGVTGSTIFSVRPLVGIGLNDNGATPGTLTLTSLASGALLYPEIRQPAGAGDLTVQLVATER